MAHRCRASGQQLSLIDDSIIDVTSALVDFQFFGRRFRGENHPLGSQHDEAEYVKPCAMTLIAFKLHIRPLG
jgi:hypothetical protein